MAWPVTVLKNDIVNFVQLENMIILEFNQTRLLYYINVLKVDLCQVIQLLQEHLNIESHQEVFHKLMDKHEFASTPSLENFLYSINALESFSIAR